jgi:tetratricopeptide (TPR) repeat protein
LAALAAGAWAVFTYLHPVEPPNKTLEPSGLSLVIGEDVQAGHDVTINPTVTIGPDGKEISGKLDELKKQNWELMALVTKLVAASPSQAAPGLKEAVTGAVDYADRGAQAGDSRLQQALDLLKQNKIAEADALFGQVAAAAEQSGRDSFKEAASAYRHQGAIALLHEPWKAREAYAKAVQLDPDNPDGLVWDGWLQLRATNLDAAERSYRTLLRLDDKGADENQLFWARGGLGDIFVARGNLPAALKVYGEARAAIERLAASDSGNARWQRDLSASYDRVGDVLVKQGNLAEALKSYRASLAIAERLASSDGGNAEWQGDLSISYEKIGNVLVAQGNLAEALKSYRASLAIRKRLASSDGGNAGWQRDLSVSYGKIGEVLVDQGDLAEALKSYRAGLPIFERLASSDGGNADWQRDLSVSYDKIGEVLVAQGNLAEALKSFRASHEIVERLASSDSGNAGWQRDLSVSYAHLGYVYINSKEYEKARDALTKGRAIIAPLVAEHPDWAQWKQDLAWFDEQLATLAPPAPAKKPAKGKPHK